MKRIIAVLVLAAFLSGCTVSPTADVVLSGADVENRSEICNASCTNLGYSHWGLLNENGKLACECTGEKCIDEDKGTAILRVCSELPAKRFYFE